MTATAAFETEPCPRCGGTGTYSYCQRWGTTCFECGVRKGQPGTGRRLTKRGKAAREYYVSLLPAKLARDLVPGDRLVETVLAMADGEIGYAGVVATVRNVRPTTSVARWTVDGVTQQADASTGHLDIITDRVTVAGVAGDSVRRLIATREQRLTAFNAALVYQDTLTKAGTPRKRQSEQYSHSAGK